MERDRKLINVELTRAENISEEKLKELGLSKDHQGLIAIETYSMRESTIKEVTVLMNMLKDSKETAYDYYEQLHKESFEKGLNLLKHKRLIRTKNQNGDKNETRL